jgi:hypothetical protein
LSDGLLKIFTYNFASLIERAAEDFIVELIMAGMLEMIIMVLGKRDFTVQDLLGLPKLPVETLSEKGVYVDYSNTDRTKKSNGARMSVREQVNSGSSPDGIKILGEPVVRLDTTKPFE